MTLLGRIPFSGHVDARKRFVDEEPSAGGPYRTPSWIAPCDEYQRAHGSRLLGWLTVWAPSLLQGFAVFLIAIGVIGFILLALVFETSVVLPIWHVVKEK